MKVLVPFNPEHALPADVRKELARFESGLLRSHCYAASETKLATGWHSVAVTEEEMRVRRERGGPMESMPTPKVIADMIPGHDAGKALRPFTAVLDTDLLTVVPTADKRKGDRHAPSADGTPRKRKSRGPHKFSRKGFTMPVSS